jgi:heptosyltransferase-1
VIGVETERIVFPFADVDSPGARAVPAADGGGPFALLNPGAAWPNKRWPPERFAEVAAFLRDVRGMRSRVWARDALARCRRRRHGADRSAADRNCRSACALAGSVSGGAVGDTADYLAAAVGMPVVALIGPTDPSGTGLGWPRTSSCHAMRPAGVTTSAGVTRRAGASARSASRR